MGSTVAIIIGSLISSGFFSGVEIAFFSASRLHIEVLNRKGTLLGRILSQFVNHEPILIITILVGNTLALVIYGTAMAELLEPSFVGWYAHFGLSPATVEILVLITQTIVSTLLVLITAEFLPKSLSLINPEGFLSVTAYPMYLLFLGFYPFSWLINQLSILMIRYVMRIKLPDEQSSFELSDLNHYIQNTESASSNADEAHGEVDAKIFENAVKFKDLKLRDCMIHRNEIVGIDVNKSVEALTQLYEESGHSKIVVYNDSIDNVIGYAHHMELFKKPKTIREAVTENMIVVPEAMLAQQMLVQLISEHKSMALIVDEFGGTSGLVTIEDIIEEIFGDIEDEYDDDSDEQVTKLEEPGTYLLYASKEVDDLNEEYGWEIPSGDYETLGGFIFSISGKVPELNEVIMNEHFEFTILSMQNARIEKVRMLVRKELAERS